MKKNSDKKFLEKKTFSDTKLNMLKRKRSPSSKSVKKYKITNNIDCANKVKKKIQNKKNQIVNKELNTISKNMKITNNAINNPNEFYVNFFNNIIQNSGYCTQDEEEIIKKRKKEKKLRINNSKVKINDINLSDRNNQPKNQIFLSTKKDIKIVREKLQLKTIRK